MHQKKGVAILGSTGSIGTQALEVIETYKDRFDLQIITANKNAELLIEQAIKHSPNTVVIADEDQYEKVKNALWDLDIHVYAGNDAIAQVVESNEVEIVLTALVGYAGLKPTLHAIRAGKHIALANKERETPEYIQLDEKNKKAKFVRVPKFEEVPYPVVMEPNLVIEYYSR